MRLLSARASSGPTVQMMQALGLASVMLIAKQQIMRGTLTVPLFLPFLIALFQVTQPLRRLLNVSRPDAAGHRRGREPCSR